MRDQLTAGIITYHEPYSYGADLQCLGLQLFLEGLGYKAEIIDYSMGAYQELRRKRPFRSLLQRGIRFFNDPKRFLKVKRNASEITRQALPFQEQLEIRNQKFKEFQDKYYNLSPQRYENYSDLKNNCPVYSAYICGSDQIWNPGFCDMDENYFLGFAPKGRRIAYAPSFGVQELPRVWRREYRKRLNNIDFLSVREKTGAEMIKKLRGGVKTVPVVMDPAFLISCDQWLEIADDSEINLPSEYILTYFIGIDEYSQKLLRAAKRAFPNDEIINLVFDQSSYGPCDFIKLISRAKFVVTNSFHGVVFSINLNIPFAVGKTLKDYGNSSAFSRMDDLLESLGLKNRIYDGKTELNDSWLQLDFAKVNDRKEKLLQSSENYLKDALIQVLERGICEKDAL